MAKIELKGLAHSYLKNPHSDSDYALKTMNLTWDNGGAYALLGPSGCGKTTLLNIISGLIKPSQGHVLFDGKDVTQLSPEHRNIAQVFQFPVIYDTMTVFDNLAFPLRNRGMRGIELKKRVEHVAELLELTSDLKYRASGLTADAKQKVSLGRGLVRNDVTAILFDEPLTVIDPHLKWILRSKLKQIHSEFKHTFIYVTHDQIEALTFADQVVIMLDGRIVQTGTPQDLFENPLHTFVGFFIGSPGMNLIPCSVMNGFAILDNGEKIKLKQQLENYQVSKNTEMVLGIRPEFVKIKQNKVEDSIPCRIKDIENLGTYKMATVLTGDIELKAKLHEDSDLAKGNAWLLFPPEQTKIYADQQLIDIRGAN